MSLKNFFPFDFSAPTLHQAQAIDPSARAQWPDLDWVQGDRIRAGHGKQPDLFMWSGHTPEGIWTLAPMPESSTYRIAFFSNLDDQQREESLRQSKQLEVNDPRRRLYALQLGMTELGYARSAEDAQALTNHLRRTSGGEDLQLARNKPSSSPRAPGASASIWNARSDATPCTWPSTPPPSSSSSIAAALTAGTTSAGSKSRPTPTMAGCFPTTGLRPSPTPWSLPRRRPSSRPTGLGPVFPPPRFAHPDWGEPIHFFSLTDGWSGYPARAPWIGRWG